MENTIVKHEKIKEIQQETSEGRLETYEVFRTTYSNGDMTVTMKVKTVESHDDSKMKKKK